MSDKKYGGYTMQTILSKCSDDDAYTPGAAIILDLIAENDKLRQAMEWISVEDRLPEFDTDVLAAYFEHHIKEYWVDKRIDFLDDETFELSCSMWTEGEPTHWQPLPPPPEPTNE